MLELIDMEQNQFDMLKTEFLLTQGQMDKYDQLAMTIKTWSVTLWVASSGWAFQAKQKELLLISIVLVLVFWFFEGINKTFRTNYKKRRDEVADILQSALISGSLPKSTATPRLPAYDLSKVFRNTFTLHIALPYCTLAFISVVLFFVAQ